MSAHWNLKQTSRPKLNVNHLPARWPVKLVLRRSFAVVPTSSTPATVLGSVPHLVPPCS